jgi:hypothetical protein
VTPPRSRTPAAGCPYRRTRREPAPATRAVARRRRRWRGGTWGTREPGAASSPRRALCFYRGWRFVGARVAVCPTMFWSLAAIRLFSFDWFSGAGKAYGIGMATGISPTGISRTFCPPKEQNVPVLIPGNVRGEGFPPSPSPRGYFSPDGGPVPD